MNLMDLFMDKLPNALGIGITLLAFSGVVGMGLRLLNQKVFKGKQPLVKTGMVFLKKYHKYFAGSVLVIGPLHGFLAIGEFRLHTGSLVMLTILLMFAIYLLGYFKILKSWLKVHRAVAVVATGFWLVHYIFPGLI